MPLGRYRAVLFTLRRLRLQFEGDKKSVDLGAHLLASEYIKRFGKASEQEAPYRNLNID